jgi:hypothetical protein
LKQADPRLSGVVIDLYDFSSAALEDVSFTIQNLRREIRETGKAIKAFSIPTSTGGITYAVTKQLDRASAQAAEVIGRKHKYDTRSDRWYVIVDTIETDSAIDALRPLVFPWKEDDGEAANSAAVQSHFRSSVTHHKVGSAKSDS